MRRLHERIKGITPDGQPYQANDPELLTWVYVTAGYGFLNAYLALRKPTPHSGRARPLPRGIPQCLPILWVNWMPSSVAEVDGYIERMRFRLRHHEILEEFLRLVSNAPIVSAAALPIQRLLVQAAIDLLPSWARKL